MRPYTNEDALGAVTDELVLIGATRAKSILAKIGHINAMMVFSDQAQSDYDEYMIEHEDANYYDATTVTMLMTGLAIYELDGETALEKLAEYIAKFEESITLTVGHVAEAMIGEKPETDDAYVILRYLTIHNSTLKKMLMDRGSDK